MRWLVRFGRGIFGSQNVAAQIVGLTRTFIGLLRHRQLVWLEHAFQSLKLNPTK